MKNFKKIKQLLHGDLDVYENFDYTQYDNTLSPGSMPANDLLQAIVREENPSLIIEVGSFLGYSASGMTAEMIKINPDSVTICVDSWMGGADHWEEATFNTTSRIKRKNGYPTFYYNFLANMCYSDLQNNILPFAYPSITAAVILQRVFEKNQLEADMIYIDGSHEYWDVILDLTNYYPLAKQGGLIFGDDWTCPDVRNAVTDFSNQHGLKLSVHPNQVHWFIRK